MSKVSARFRTERSYLASAESARLLWPGFLMRLADFGGLHSGMRLKWYIPLAGVFIGPLLGVSMIEPSNGQQPDAAEDGSRKLFPHLRIHTEERWLELDGFVPITVDDPDAPLVYLEQVVCGRESPEIHAGKEHESLVATNAKGSHIHAGLLLLGLEPGTPVRWSTDEDGSIISHPATGPKVQVEFLWVDEQGEAQRQAPQEWIRHAETKERFPNGDWLFSGSVFVTFGGNEVYDADRSGTLIGLAAFGSEVLSWQTPIHHESGIATPVWSANNDTVPPFKTPVRVRLTVLQQDQPHDSGIGESEELPSMPEG